uniref:Uncharacterized protein n=1 Tax=Sphaerodactylus townsendi TaxID=933632 RepID=A0ACB8FTE2_9SAUR
MSTQSEPENLVPEELENLEFEESENIEELENLEPEESENLEPEESEHLEPEESENLVPEKLEKLEPEESEKPEPEKLEKAPRKIYYCDICNIPCLSAMVMQTHIAGLRHKKDKAHLIEHSSIPWIFSPLFSFLEHVALGIRLLGAKDLNGFEVHSFLLNVCLALM